MVIDFGIFWNGRGTLHNPDGVIVVPAASQRRLKIGGMNSLMADLHFSPFTPHLGKIFHRFEVYLGALFQDFASTVEVWLRLPSSSSFFVKLGEIDI
jgi:hypothetical protein